MFTGIVQGTYGVTSVHRELDLLTYAVDLDAERVDGLEIGASVSIDGVCQTVVSIEGHRVSFDAIRETLDRTTLGALQAGDQVAVERSARVGDEVGGHDVSGHVIGQGEVVLARKEGHVCVLGIGVPPSWMKYVLNKGFIAVDGSSLTVCDATADGSFAVHLIPETLRLTRLGQKRLGDRLNIELDPRTVAIVDTVERVMEERES
ncbi:MAG TPA: riboflavin synthase subunit alpha [Myxococcales bacterium]|jgi:riboflavin synthase|nr:riboflavin synthase subunit alpha [Myxococcales bacterium]HIL02637.1 riboflavin synthase subunit alpha [Myxococcales bacterium]